jgi:hypothetical protein
MVIDAKLVLEAKKDPLMEAVFTPGCILRMLLLFGRWCWGA